MAERAKLKYSSLSKILQERSLEDRQNHWENPWRFRDEDALRRKMVSSTHASWQPHRSVRG